MHNVADKSDNISSNTSLRSFHFDDEREEYRDGGNFETISTGSANERGSGGVKSAHKRSVVKHPTAS